MVCVEESLLHAVHVEHCGECCMIMVRRYWRGLQPSLPCYVTSVKESICCLLYRTLEPTWVETLFGNRGRAVDDQDEATAELFVGDRTIANISVPWTTCSPNLQDQKLSAQPSTRGAFLIVLYREFKSHETIVLKRN